MSRAVWVDVVRGLLHGAAAACVGFSHSSWAVAAVLFTCLAMCLREYCALLRIRI